MKMMNQAVLPFTYAWIIRKCLDAFKSVLDLGCSDGVLMEKVNYDQKFEVTGVDLFKPDLLKAKKKNVYKKLIHADIRKLKLNQSFDVVLSSQVIEHLTRKEGEKLIKRMERLAEKRVVIATTVGFLPYNPIQGDESGNIFQEHKSGWKLEEFQKLGYRVYGQGTRFIYKEGCILRNAPEYTHPLFFGLSYLFSPINYYFPETSAYLQIAVKDF